MRWVAWIAVEIVLVFAVPLTVGLIVAITSVRRR